MRVLLTGASGFVGSYTFPALVERGHEVRLLLRNVDKARHVLGRRGVDLASVDVVTGDMLDAETVKQAATGCDATIHAAAAIGITGGSSNSLLEINTTGARNVVGAARAAGHDPIVHVSSVAIFVPPHGPVIRADSPLASPRTEYGRSKVQTELELRALQDEGAPITILYPGGVIGPDQPTLDATLEGINQLRAVATREYQPGAEYPKTELARRLEIERSEYDRLMSSLEQLYRGGALAHDAGPQSVFVEGVANLLVNEADRERLRDMVRTLEERQRLVELLSAYVDTKQEAVRVVIGLEDQMPQMRNLVLIGAPARVGNEVRGSLAVIGPMRIDYEHTITAVSYIAQLFDKVFNDKD